MTMWAEIAITALGLSPAVGGMTWFVVDAWGQP